MHDGMRFLRSAACYLVTLVLATLSIMPLRGVAANPAKSQAPSIEQTSRVTIEVSGGEKETPVENASVYLKYVEERKIRKDKVLELNVKTNRDGAAHIPSAPFGRVLIQVVADGWKTYGRWYDITEAKQTFKVHLVRPPKWY
jgi:hypothetical protein